VLCPNGALFGPDDENGEIVPISAAMAMSRRPWGAALVLSYTITSFAPS